MKVAVCSDLHLEFEDINLKNEEGAEVLVLSGDILVAADLDIYDRRQEEMGFARARSQRFQDFFSRVCFQFPHVVYVAGNHEHYHGDFKYTLSDLKMKLGRHPNLHILDKEVFQLGDYKFVGSTLWTDMNKEDPLTLYHIKQMMNDFRCVKNSNREVSYKTYQPINKPVGVTDEDFLALPHEKRFTTVFKTKPAVFCPEDAVEEHKKSLEYIKFIVSEAKPHEKVVVVGHHTPSLRSCAEKYNNDPTMNGGYHSSLDDFIMDHPQIALWTHGHTHENMDYMIGDTRVFCNPRGYAGWDDTAASFQLKVLEV
jgi:Icc-related predicted phosphoesterase